MNCPSCQNEIPEFSNSCSVCGYRASQVKTNKSGCFFIIGVLVIIFIGVLAGLFFVINAEPEFISEKPIKQESFVLENQKNYQSSEEYLVNYAQEIRKSSNLPQKLNQWATWTDTKADGYALHHFYMMTADYEPSFYVNNIRPSTVEKVCRNPNIYKNIFSRGYYLKFSYNIEGSTKVVRYSITQSDCN
jgi:hypothetical protein